MDNFTAIETKKNMDNSNIIGTITFEQYLNGNWVNLIILPATKEEEAERYADLLTLKDYLQLFHGDKYVICSQKHGPIKITFVKNKKRR